MYVYVCAMVERLYIVVWSSMAIHPIPVVPHKAAAEVSTIGYYRRGELLMHGWQSESTDGPKGGWSCACWSGCNGCSVHLTHNSWM